MKATWEKVFEYASMPLHGSLSRKLRKGIKIQVNEGKIYEDAVLFLGEEFVRFSEENESDNVIPITTGRGWTQSGLTAPRNDHVGRR